LRGGNVFPDSGKIEVFKHKKSFLHLTEAGNREAVVNYMEKYVAKDGNIEYCKKRFYRTQNLDFKNKSIVYFEDGSDCDRFIQSLGLETVKDNDKLTVYRKSKDIK
jgi:hypothetical protein